MNISVNGEQRSVEDAISVAELVALLLGASSDARGVAVALNGEVVARSNWANAWLADGDRIEVLRAIGGGA